MGIKRGNAPLASFVHLINDLGFRRLQGRRLFVRQVRLRAKAQVLAAGGIAVEGVCPRRSPAPRAAQKTTTKQALTVITAKALTLFQLKMIFLFHTRGSMPLTA